MSREFEIEIPEELYERLKRQGNKHGFVSPSLFSDHLLKELHSIVSQQALPLSLPPRDGVPSYELRNILKPAPTSPR